MVTVAIISEYNPFHTGHKHHVNKIREEFGTNTRIISIMSGNYTQRGEIAIMDKSLRAECAVKSGVNLVLELPFPFSMASAEIFAKCGVSLASKISVVDYLSFGSESGDINELYRVAKNMISTKYNAELMRLIKNDTKLGYATCMEIAYKNIYSYEIKNVSFTPNNILALEYIKQIIKQNSRIKPHTIKRCGSDYSEDNITDNQHQSATAIRNLLNTDIHSALDYIPKETIDVIFNAYNRKQLPTDAEKNSSAIISHFRLNSSSRKIKTHDSDEGLYNRLKNSSFQTDTITGLIELTDTKKYTHARIRRAIWYSFFGVTSSEIKKVPKYTQVLAMDSVGKSILKAIKKMTDFPVVTKPSATASLPDDAKLQKARSDLADSIFQMTKPSFSPGDASLTKTPFILN